MAVPERQRLVAMVKEAVAERAGATLSAKSNIAESFGLLAPQVNAIIHWYHYKQCEFQRTSLIGCTERGYFGAPKRVREEKMPETITIDSSSSDDDGRKPNKRRSTRVTIDKRGSSSCHETITIESSSSEDDGRKANNCQSSSDDNADDELDVPTFAKRGSSSSMTIVMRRN